MLWLNFLLVIFMTSFIEILGRQIPIYGLLWFVGIFAAGIVGTLICPKHGIEKFDLVCSAIYSVICGVIGSKILFIAVSLDKIIEYRLPFINILKGGFVFYGGLLGGIIGLWIYTRQFKLNFTDFANLYAVLLPLGHAFGRVGCFFGGCCYGMKYSGPFAVKYSFVHGTTPLNVSLFPIQLLEALVLLLIFASLLIYYSRHNAKCHCAEYYIISYGICRFIIEFFRGDDVRGLFLGISTSQWISVFLVLAAVGILLHKKISPRGED